MDLKIEQTLESLITTNNSLGRQIITGFNYHMVCLSADVSTIITFSNVQSSQNYLSKVMEDLAKMGYPNDEISISTRDKNGYFKWRPEFFIRNEQGILEDDLNIKNVKTGISLDLKEIPYQTLKDAGYSEQDVEDPIAENKGYEINIFLANPTTLCKLAAKFLLKSSRRLYNDEGDLVYESEEEIEQRNPWPSAWDVPMLIVGGDLSQIQHSIPGFQSAFLFRFQDQSIGEYNFVINNQMGVLKMSDQYKTLQDQGFKQEQCLANIRFVKDYVDVL